MGRLFDFDSPIMQGLQKVANVIFCGFFWILLCMPIFTAGASTTAMYRCLFNIREEKSSRVADFFRFFVREFKKSTLLCLIQILSGTVLLVLFYSLLRLDLNIAGQLIVMVLFILLAGCWLFTFAFVYPLTAYFENSVFNTIKNGLLMAGTHRRRSVPILALKMLPVIVGFFTWCISYELFLYVILTILPVWVFVIIPVLAYVQSGMFLRIFEQYLPEDVPSGEKSSETGSETADTPEACIQMKDET